LPLFFNHIAIPKTGPAAIPYKKQIKILQKLIYPYLCRPKTEREFSSVGLEHPDYSREDHRFGKIIREFSSVGLEHPDYSREDHRFGKIIREFSSVGLEHLPYKQRVTGSSPVTPTKPHRNVRFFI
jgi:hypothetical protein